MNESWIYSAGTFFYFIFHLVALILALVNWRRYPNVCMLVLAGSVLNVAAICARFGISWFWFRLFEERMTYAFVNLGISLVNLAGSALYLTAIFSGRTPFTPRPPRPRRYDDEDDLDRPAPPKPDPDSTGIQSR